MTGLARDFVGYGPRPPDPGWPGGARLALNFVINYEEGSEPSIGDGDGVSEARLTEAAQSRCREASVISPPSRCSSSDRGSGSGA